MTSLVRAVRLAGWAVVSLVLVAFLAVQAQQWMLRWRSERLLADMHGIRLYRSSWADAQRLMHRWGSWGGYEGSCTAADCVYEIEISNPASINPHVPRHAWVDWLMVHDRMNLYQWLGGRGSAYKASFTVHDGTIWRESAAIGVEVPRRRMRRENDFDLTLYLSADSHQRLHRTLEDWFFLGSDEGLGRHPYYKVGRSGGCKINCEMGVVYFSTHTPPVEITRLTSYDFSCFTRFKPCSELEDLLPAATEWHLYQEAPQQYPIPPEPCDVPAWALARDTRYVLAVEALSAKMVREGGYQSEVIKVRIVGSLKEPAPWVTGSVVSAHPFDWGSGSGGAKTLIPGSRYIVFAAGNDSRDRMVTRNSPMALERCGVWDDTPEVRNELEKGFAQNDALRP